MSIPTGPELDTARFAVQPRGELSPEILGKRWRSVQAILRMATITGSQMELGPALNLICDLAAMTTNVDSACVYFWNEPQEKTELRLRRGHINDGPQVPCGGNSTHSWATHQAQRPLRAAG